ncbi:MAG: L-fucose/L-arabinose isomerase family protein [Candidatus Solibacter sp.]|jgi:L-arabinose isomerase
MSETVNQGRVGVFGIGLHAYWEQFPGLKQRLEGYQRLVEAQVAGFGVEVVSAGLVDTAPAAEEAGDLFARAGLDLILCYIGTYATSSQVLPVVQRAKVPVLVLNLQPCAALDYEHTDTGEWLANCSVCCAPEIANAFARAGVRFRVVSGMLHEDAAVWGEIADWCRAAGVARALRGSRIGFLGHTYPGMLDMYSDFTSVSAQAGVHVEVLEMCDLDECVEQASAGEVEEKIAVARRIFDMEDVAADDLAWAAQVAAGLDRLVERFRLNGLTYYYRGLAGNRYERLSAGLILGNSLLTARGVAASGEGDLKTCVAMTMLDRMGVGGSYTEFYAMDFRERFVLMGHDGPMHLAIADGRPVLRGLGLYHGKRGSGVSVECRVKTGPVTLLALTQTAEGRLKLLAAEGESIAGPLLKIGNTNSRVRFALPPGEFINRWCSHAPTHHFALGVGHRRAAVAKVAELMGIALEVVE